MAEDDNIAHRALVRESIRTPAQRLAIVQLLDEYGDFHVDGPLSDGCLELRKGDRHLCFVAPDGSLV